jgi:hypothetical protein
VRARGGPRAADVCGSLWLESQLLLQISAADGCADGDPDDNDIPVSEKILHGSEHPTEALEAVLSPTRLVFFLSMCFQLNALVSFDIFFVSLSKSIRACAGLNRVRVLVGHPQTGGVQKTGRCCFMLESWRVFACDLSGYPVDLWMCVCVPGVARTLW